MVAGSTRSVASHTPPIPAQKLDLFLGESAGPLGPAEGLGRLAPLAVTGGEEGLGVDLVERVTDGVRQFDGVHEMGEPPVEVAEKQMTPSGEDVGGHALIGPEPVAEYPVALGSVDDERPGGVVQGFPGAPLPAAGEAQLDPPRTASMSSARASAMARTRSASSAPRAMSPLFR